MNRTVAMLSLLLSGAISVAEAQQQGYTPDKIRQLAAGLPPEK